MLPLESKRRPYTYILVWSFGLRSFVAAFTSKNLKVLDIYHHGRKQDHLGVGTETLTKEGGSNAAKKKRDIPKCDDIQHSFMLSVLVAMTTDIVYI